MAFDPLNLLLLAIALVVFWRLKSVLGTRTGNERPPFDPRGTSRTGESAKAPADGDKRIVRFPTQDSANDDGRQPEAGAEPETPLWTGYAEAGSQLAGALDQIAAADRTFTPKSFVDGAKVAYEMIVEAFARGDKQALKPLLSSDVFDGFSRAIDERQAAGQTMEFRFVGIDKATIKSAELEGSRVAITMEFVSEMISATLAKSGDVVDGDPKLIREVSDVWTFERDVTSRNPNWRLVATDAPA